MSEVRFAHVDKGRLATLDGRSLDDGTPEEVAGTVDIEDYAILFELLFRKTGKTGTRSGRLSTPPRESPASSCACRQKLRSVVP